MLNKDKRSLLFTLVLGDGCLHYTAKDRYKTGGITIAHAENQADWISWKASLLGQIFSRTVNVRFNKKVGSFKGYGSQNQYQISVTNKKLRVWRKFTYPNGKKSLPLLLKYIRHVDMAMAIWLADDGYVEPSITHGKLYGARFRLFTCDQSEGDHKAIIGWLKTNCGVDAKVHYQNNRGKSYPFLKLNGKDSLALWERIRPFLLSFKSMRHKFRHIEEHYQYKLAQRKLDPKV